MYGGGLRKYLKCLFETLGHLNKTAFNFPKNSNIMQGLEKMNVATLGGLEKTTHLFKTRCTNRDNTTKTIFSFIDLSSDWFDIDLFDFSSDFPTVNGGTFGKIESINAQLGKLYRSDDSTKEYQTTIYSVNPFKEVIRFCNVVK